MHRSIQQALRALTRTETDDWVTLLPMVEFAINSTPSATTGRSPFGVVYGSETAVVMPLDKMLGNPSAVPAADDLTEQVERVVRETREHMLHAQRVQKSAYDKRCRDVQYSVGE